MHPGDVVQIELDPNASQEGWWRYIRARGDPMDRYDLLVIGGGAAGINAVKVATSVVDLILEA